MSSGVGAHGRVLQAGSRMLGALPLTALLLTKRRSVDFCRVAASLCRTC